MSYDVTNFQEDVIVASSIKPVLVDFWAPWCGPCKTLGPILEKLAATSDSWTLVKVNSDEHKDISARFEIRGIPAVRLFVNGVVVDEFTGALPELAVRQWLEKAIPSPVAKSIAEAESLIENGDIVSAKTQLEDVLMTEPTNVTASGLLAGIIGLTDPDRALILARTAVTGEPRFIQIADAVQALDSVRTRTEEIEEMPENRAKSDYVSAVAALANKEWEWAIQGFIETIKKDRYFDDDGSRKAVVALFTLLGPGHELTKKYRREFDMWLY